MSFHAWLDTIGDKTGLTPRQFIEQAREKGFDGPRVKAGVIVDCLKEEYGLDRGHAMALVHVIRNGPEIDAKHVGTNGTHRDDSATVWLDGKAARPQYPAERPCFRELGADATPTPKTSSPGLAPSLAQCARV